MSTTLAFAPTERETIALPLPDLLSAPPIPAIPWDMPKVAPVAHRHSHVRIANCLFNWGVGTLILLSGGVSVYRLLWMGQ